jgi:hypothetical protein
MNLSAALADSHVSRRTNFYEVNGALQAGLRARFIAEELRELEPRLRAFGEVVLGRNPAVAQLERERVLADET